MKHIDEIFKEKLYNHEAEVPDGMWEKIAPIAEEESGRAILWFWFAGLLALLIGGFGIFKMTMSDIPETSDPSALVQNNPISKPSVELVVDNNLTANTNSNTHKEIESTVNVLESSTSSDIEKSASEIKKPEISKEIASKSSSKPTSSKFVSTEKIIPAPTNDQVSVVNNTVESIPIVEGTPANLVITKSYVNNAGSIIKQSNLSDVSSNDGPVYDVIINSEAKDLSAGALLRIIEPLENIPLPAFQKKLKKKTPDSIF